MTSTTSGYKEFPCDLCGVDEPIEIPHSRYYTNNEPVHVCGRCGFVYVRSRRPSEEVARVWSDELYGGHYTAKAHPMMLPRYAYVGGFMDSNFPLKGKKVCDIGAGEGLFLKYLKDNHGVGETLGIEPSPRNCKDLEKLGIRPFTGTMEQFIAAPESKTYRADVATILWTLETCSSCIEMLRGAAAVLPEGGRLVVATGSRILVPFKKPLFYYFSKTPTDTHCSRFSVNSLQTALALAGFRTVATNRYLDNDVLCVMGEKVADPTVLKPKMDHPLEVLSYFERWHKETLHYLDHWRA